MVGLAGGPDAAVGAGVYAMTTKVIYPAPLSYEAVRAQVQSAMQSAVLPLLRREFDKTTATWRNKPAFTAEVKAEPGRIVGEYATTSDIYRYVSGGTRVRYATMSADFVAKTQPRFIGSGPGRGGVVFISRQHPRPGIEAREFDITIANQQAIKIAGILSRALHYGLLASGHGVNK